MSGRQREKWEWLKSHTDLLQMLQFTGKLTQGWSFIEAGVFIIDAWVCEKDIVSQI